MAKLPEPPTPDVLAALTPRWRMLPKGQALWRVYLRGGAHPTRWHELRAFGPANGRFDHHLPPPREQERGVLYAAASGVTCLAEVFQDTREIDRYAREPWIVAFALRKPLRLLDLTGAWTTQIGASMALSSGPRPRAQRWARALYAAFPRAQGVFYPSVMHAHAPSVALWERGRGVLPQQPGFHRALGDPGLWAPVRNAARELGYIVS